MPASNGRQYIPSERLPTHISGDAAYKTMTFAADAGQEKAARSSYTLVTVRILWKNRIYEQGDPDEGARGLMVTRCCTLQCGVAGDGSPNFVATSGGIKLMPTCLATKLNWQLKTKPVT
jgi:hypothetical protein